MYYECLASWNVTFYNGPYFRKSLPNSANNKVTGFAPSRCLVRTADVLSSSYILTPYFGEE
jgi:hypothetical protein